MKKLIPGIALLLLFTACGNEAPKETPKEVPAAKEDLSSNPDYQNGLALVANHDCLTCHKINEASVGPAYAEVAAKYAGAVDTTITRLANTIIKGGSGHWGTVPMVAHPTLTEDDAKQMVKYVLLLKK